MKRSIHGVAWVLLVLTAVLLWPRALGGTMTYVVTSGTSMEPTFRAGDLAVLRSADEYDVGDVVAYRSAALDRVVMHRIRTDVDGTYTLQGDNNDFVDPDRVRDDEVLGKLALRVPKVGLVAAWLLRPVNILLAVGALYLMLADRRPKQPAVAIADLDLVDSTCVADVVDERELVRLASASGRPVLRNAATGESFVHDGAVVYRHQAPVPVVVHPQTYADPVALLPRPREADPLVCGLDLSRLLRRG